MGFPLILWSLTFLDSPLPMHVWFCWPDPYNVLYYHFWPQKPLNSPDYGPKTTMKGCMIGKMVNCNTFSCITALPALPRLLSQQKFAFQSTSFSCHCGYLDSASPLLLRGFSFCTQMTGCMIGRMVNCNTFSCITALPALPRLLSQQKIAFQSTSFYVIYFPEDCFTCIKVDYGTILYLSIVLCKKYLGLVSWKYIIPCMVPYVL